MLFFRRANSLIVVLTQGLGCNFLVLEMFGFEMFGLQGLSVSPQITKILCTVLGASLLLLVAYDVFQTILHARGRTGPISEVINRTTWNVMRWIAGRFAPPMRHKVLNLVGPTLLPMLIVIGVTMLIVGYALIYYPHLPDEFQIDDAIKDLPRWDNALYFSGVSLLTVGYGDITPITISMRTVALFEGASGFALISLAISYVVTVYRSLERKREIGLSFYHQADEGADVEGIIEHHFVNGKFIGFRDAMSRAVQDIHEMNESHFEHPIIHFFHPVEVYRNIPRTLFLMLETCAIVRTCLKRDTYPETYNCPEVRTVETSSRYVLKNFIAAHSLESSVGQNVETEEHRQARWHKRWQHTITKLERAGIKVRDNKEKSLADYCKRREDWESRLQHYSAYLGYDWNEISGDDNLRAAEDAGVKELGTDDD